MRRSSSKKYTHPLRHQQNIEQQQYQIGQTEDLEQIAPYDESGDDNIFLTEELEIMQSNTVSNLSGDELDQIDLATDNLPAVDTPDACDKAAIRYI